MKSIAMDVSYDGTRYSGLQVQKNGTTIQGIIENSLARITSRSMRIRYAGRTDAGVHAVGQVISFHTESSMSAVQFHAALNSLLPPDIRVMGTRDVSPEFHPRYDAMKRWYRYLISTAPQRIPFFNNYALWIPRKIDAELLRSYCARVCGEHDFTSFASPEKGDNPVRRVYECAVGARNDFLHIDITGNSFLRKMVRTIVGTFLELEKRRDSPHNIEEILHARDRGRAGNTAFAGGLYLMKVYYRDAVPGNRRDS
jgi:tRNA pseudouridine38-40 synthase